MSPRRTVQVPWLCALRCQIHCQGLSPGAPSPLRSGCQLSAPGQLPPPHCGGGGAGLGQPSGLQELRDGEGEGSSPGGRSPSSPAWDAGRDCLSTGPGPLGRGPLLPQVHARAWGLGQGLRAGLRCGRRGRSAQCARARQVQLPGRRRAGAAAGARGDPRRTPPLRRATEPGWEGPTCRGDTPYTARPALPGPRPGRSFFGQHRGPGRGPRPRIGRGRGL